SGAACTSSSRPLIVRLAMLSLQDSGDAVVASGAPPEGLRAVDSTGHRLAVAVDEKIPPNLARLFKLAQQWRRHAADEGGRTRPPAQGLPAPATGGVGSSWRVCATPGSPPRPGPVWPATTAHPRRHRPAAPTPGRCWRLPPARSGYGKPRAPIAGGRCAPGASHGGSRRGLVGVGL